MAAIWHRAGDEWRLLSPVTFPDEATLHNLVHETPQLLPLSGSPQLVVIGREVYLGGNSADLVAVEPSGRISVIEVKLARNSEARRAIVAQVLTYAAFLQGLDVATLETVLLAPHLRAANASTIAELVARNDQQGSFSDASFAFGLADSLATGQFRLVLVLDSAPPELVRLCGYLQSMADGLVIDLVAVSAYDVGGQQVLVPQRVEPERVMSEASRTPNAPPQVRGTFSAGAERFEFAIDRAPSERQPALRRLAAFARSLEQEGLARLQSYEGPAMTTLLPKLQPDDVGLVTIGNTPRPLWLFRSVWERHAPDEIARAEAIVGQRIGQGTTVEPTDELLAVVLAAYRQAKRVR